MTRFPEEVLEKIKHQTDLPALFRAKGIELREKGSGFICCCPFHDDKQPSCHLNKPNGYWLYNCFACEQSGDAITFIKDMEGVSFRHAVEILSNGNGNGNVVSQTDRALKKTTVPRLPPPVSFSAEDNELLDQVIGFYQDKLKQTPDALDYLKERGLNHPEIIDTFRLGFSDRTLGLRLPMSNRKQGADIRNQLKSIGLYRQNGREHFRGCLVIPIMDKNGLITEVYGRKIGKLRPNTPKHLYLPGPHRGIWNSAALQQEEIIICESLVDSLTFWVHGFRNVTATYGVSGMTDELFDAIVSGPVKVVRFAYDHDEAGNKNALKHAERFQVSGIDCFRIIFPKNMDANEYALSVDNPHDSLQQLINGARWLGKGDSVSLTAEATAKPPPKLTVPIPVQQSGDKIEISFDNRHYRIFGLLKNMSFGVLKINLRILVDELFYDDEVNLYKARSKTNFIKAAALEVTVDEQVIKKDLGKLVLKLEELQEEQILEAMEPKNKPVVLTDSERDEALALLKTPNLLERIIADYETCGVVGEKTNIAVGYLAGVSRLLKKPLGVIIQSSSAAGKTYLMDSILDFMPEESVIRYSAMTGQSLFYMGETELKHKILAIEEQEGAEKINYSLKLLLSEGHLVIKSTDKNPTTGRHEAHDYHVEGPMAPFSSTTCLVIHDELQNRVIILTVNESRDQTRKIHKQQRWLRTLEGRQAKTEQDHIKHVHRNAQRLLKPLDVVNPYACSLTFIDDKTRTRRDQLKYLTLIDAIALLHQYQRPVKSYTFRGKEHRYIEVTREDIKIANSLASEILGRSLDELPPHTRQFLSFLDEFVTAECEKEKKDRCDYRFIRRFLCEQTGWSYDQVRIHLQRLVDLEYVLMHKGGRGHQCIYELLYDGKGKDGKPFMIGLLDVQSLKDPQKA